MQLFFIDCEHGNDKFVFARSNHHAAEIFVTWQIVNKAQMGGFTIQRVTIASCAEPDATHLRHALKQELDGIGRYDVANGWIIDPVTDDAEK
jgi:hypothetical protein